MKSKIIILILTVSLAVFTINCSGFLEGGWLDSNPNTADVVPLTSQFVAMQPITYGFYSADAGIFSSIFMQHMAGLSNQYIGYEVYGMTNVEDFGMFNQLYMTGGLIDMKDIKAKCIEEERTTMLAVTKMYEALLFATGADLFGDIPYTEAANSDIENPKYDTQLSVHTACIALLDEAISALGSASDFYDDNLDFSFGGDRSHMIAAAYSLKARILLNWAEVNNGNYALALTAAQNGISSTSEDWSIPFADSGDEQNVWYQFLNERGEGYAKPAKYLVDLMNATSDPRRPLYFELDDNDEYSGSEHASWDGEVSSLNTSDGYGSAAWDLDIISYEETLFMIAECQYQAGDEAEALATVNTALGVVEAKLGLASDSIQRISGLTGTALLEAIMVEKYKTLFLSPQCWNDWKRTGFPQISSNADKDIPRRYMYPDDEANTNSNFPGVLTMWGRNQNDPGDPLYLKK